MTNHTRPTSPHLQIYKLPATGVISITHRITGVLLSVGLLFFVCQVSVLADGASSYMKLQQAMDNGLSRLIFWAVIYSLFFHLCHGVRHLIWDAGYGFERETMARLVVIELTASLALTLAALLFF